MLHNPYFTHIHDVPHSVSFDWPMLWRLFQSFSSLVIARFLRVDETCCLPRGSMHRTNVNNFFLLRPIIVEKTINSSVPRKIERGRARHRLQMRIIRTAKDFIAIPRRCPINLANFQSSPFHLSFELFVWRARVFVCVCVANRQMTVCLHSMSNVEVDDVCGCISTN